VRGRVRRSLRNLLLRVLDHVPPFKARLALQLSGIARRALAEAPDAVAGVAERAALRLAA